MVGASVRDSMFIGLPSNFSNMESASVENAAVPKRHSIMAKWIMAVFIIMESRGAHTFSGERWTPEISFPNGFWVFPDSSDPMEIARLAVWRAASRNPG